MLTEHPTQHNTAETRREAQDDAIEKDQVQAVRRAII